LPEIIDLLLLGAGQLVTCGCSSGGPKRKNELDDVCLVENGAVAVANGRILFAGAETDVLEKVSSVSVKKTIDAGGRVVLPGWVDPHTHAVFSGYRVDEFEARIRGKSYLEIARNGGGINRTVSEVRSMDEDELFEKSRRRLMKILEYGTTTIEIKSGYGLETESELKMLRVVKKLDEDTPMDTVATFLGAHERPPEYRSSDDYIDVVVSEMLPAVTADSLAEFIDVFCEEGVFSVEESRTILEAGLKRGLRAKIHADEITPLGGAELAVEVGAISADHLTKVTERGMARLAQSETVAVLLPATTFGLISKSFAPARSLIDTGAAVALASDYNPGSSPASSMQFVVSIACSQMRLTPAEAINAATINAAYAVGRQSEVGSIEPGKKADLVIYDVEDYREIAARAGSNHACMVLKEGDLVWEKEGFRETSEVGF